MNTSLLKFRVARLWLTVRQTSVHFLALHGLYTQTYFIIKVPFDLSLFFFNFINYEMFDIWGWTKRKNCMLICYTTFSRHPVFHRCQACRQERTPNRQGERTVGKWGWTSLKTFCMEKQSTYHSTFQIDSCLEIATSLVRLPEIPQTIGHKQNNILMIPFGTLKAKC